MGRKNRQNRHKLYLPSRYTDLSSRLKETDVYSQDIREEKAAAVKKFLGEYQVENYREIKKLYIILDLWVKHNREHQEFIDLPFAQNRKLEIRLFNHVDKECKVLIHQN